MLLAINVGNTNIHYGLFEGERLARRFRVATDRGQTADEYGVVLRRLLEGDESGAARSVTRVILASVVPPVTSTLIEAVDRYLGRQPFVVRAGARTGLDIRYETPATLGADRVVDAVAAVALYGVPVITVDFGTATVLNVINSRRQFLGGAIAPGLRTAADALSRSGARLTSIELTAPPGVIGRTTRHSLQSGVLYGYVGLVEGLIRRLREALAAAEPEELRPKVVATGGLVGVLGPLIPAIDVIDPALTLTGLRVLAEMNEM